MVEAELMGAIIDVSSRISVVVVLVFMLIVDRRAHKEEKEQLRKDIDAKDRQLRDKERELVDVLKEVSGIRSNMWNVQAMTRGNRESDTRPLRIPDDVE